MKKTIYVLFACLCFLQAYTQSNEGTVFWFGFMEHVDDGANSMAVLVSSKTNTKGRLSVPSLQFSRNFSVAAEEVTIIQLPSQAENIGSEIVSDKGILIETQEPVSVYIHQYANMRSEASLVLPVGSLGQDYYIMTYEGIRINNNNHYSEFLIVATEDDTSVEIKVTAETQRGIKPGDSKLITLNKGQTYQVQTNVASADLTGSRVVSDKKIGVLAGSEWSQIPVECGFRDNLLEQMYPVGTWGRRYFTVPSIYASYDIYRIMAAENETEVVVNAGSVENTYNLQAGEFVEYRLSNMPAEIRANKGVLVAQYNIGSTCSGHQYGDPSYLLINPVEQSKDTVTLYNSSFENIFENYITAIIKTEDIGISTFDGAPIASLATRTGIIPNSKYTYFILTVSTGAHTLISPGCGVIAHAYGYGNVESYSYGGGASFINVNDNPLPDGGCLNDTVFFNSGLSPFRYDVDWDLGDGTFASGTEVEHIYRELGSYAVKMTFIDKCLEVGGEKEKEIFITLRDEVFAPDSVIGCENLTINLEASDLAGATYLWKGPNDYSSEEQYPDVGPLGDTSAGDYTVVGIISGCATFPKITYLQVDPAPVPRITVDSIFCSRQQVVNLEAGIFESYNWSTGSSAQQIEVNSQGLYSVTVTNEFDCPGSTAIELYDICPAEIYVPNIFSPNEDGINDFFTITTYQVESLEITIYDRWGDQVYYSQNMEEYWDGTSIGNRLNEGVYTYYIQYIGGDEEGNQKTFSKKGSITLIR